MGLRTLCIDETLFVGFSRPLLLGIETSPTARSGYEHTNVSLFLLVVLGSGVVNEEDTLLLIGFILRVSFSPIVPFILLIGSMYNVVNEYSLSLALVFSSHPHTYFPCTSRENDDHHSV